MTTDYTDPATIDVDVVIGNINHAHRMRGHTWTDERSWPNVTVKALADEIERLRAAAGSPPPTPDDQCADSATADGAHCKCELETCCWCGVSRPATAWAPEELESIKALRAWAEENRYLNTLAAHALTVLDLAVSAGPPPTNGPTRQQVSQTIDEMTHLPLTQLQAVTDAVWALLASHRPDNDPEQRRAELLAEIAERRNDPEFMQRLAASIERNRDVLDRLGEQ